MYAAAIAGAEVVRGRSRGVREQHVRSHAPGGAVGVRRRAGGATGEGEHGVVAGAAGAVHGPGDVQVGGGGDGCRRDFFGCGGSLVDVCVCVLVCYIYIYVYI